MGSSVNGFNIGLVPKLEGTKNYDQWAPLVMSCLKSTYVWKYILGTAVPPVQYLKELDHVFSDRLELYHGKEAQTRNIILCTCSSYIQQSLHDIESPKACWDKLKAAYQAEGLVYHHHIWMKFAHFKYEHEPIEEWCLKYTALLDKYASGGVTIPEDIKVMNFLGILEPYYTHWSANKRDHLRRD